MGLSIKQPDAGPAFTKAFLTDTDFTGNEGEVVAMAADDTVAICTDEADIAIGVVDEVLWWDSVASEGKVVVALFGPIRKVKLTAALTSGTVVSPDDGTAGQVGTAASTDRAIGVLIGSGADGDVVEMVAGLQSHLLA